MQPLLVRELLQATGGILVRGDTYRRVHRLSLDSRTLQKGDLFVAIRGPHFDGHKFIGEAIYKGALGIVVEKEWPLATIENADFLPGVIIKVEQTTKALGDIAAFYRRQILCPVIAVTGSVGKTTTKDVIATVLRERFLVGSTRETQNNHIGVPLSLLGLSAGIGAAVIELGMNRLGEINYLAGLTRPDVGIITNVGPVHLEHLGLVTNVVKAKAELLGQMDGDGLVLLNSDDQFFSQLRKKVRSKMLTVGRSAAADIQALNPAVNSQGNLQFAVIAKPYEERFEVNLPVPGMHNVYPALFAVALAFALGLTRDQISRGLSKVQLPKRRLQIKEVAGIRLIDDCYNANPLSMASALETMAALNCRGKRILVCGDMLELGTEAVWYHRELGRKMSSYGISRLVTMGDLARLVAEDAVAMGMSKRAVKHCPTNLEAVHVLGEWLEPGDLILVKGSRANHMEEIVQGIEEYYSALEQLIV